jgi:CDP-glucose 4,6-dehydratase
VKNVLITGINGFAGSALAQRLLDTRPDVRVVGLVKDRNFKSRRDILDRCSVVYGDLCDINQVRYALSRYEVDTVFHLAAVTILRQSVMDALSCYQVNVMGTVNVLEAAKQVGVQKVVSVSSDKAYGTYDNLPYVESMPVQASPDPYSTSKACMDLISQSYATTYGLNVSILRAGNKYGPGDLNLSRLIPRSILRCLEGRAPQLYNGVGQYKREFMYIEDVVDAYLCVAERGLPGEAYNVGGSGFQTVFDTVNKICQLVGFKGEPEVVDKDFIEIKEQYLDSAKIERLGWKCTHSIDQGLEKTVDWYTRYAKDPSQRKAMFFTA